MPSYDYACPHCGHRFEVVHRIHDAGPEACPACGRAGVRKALVAPAIHFKGSGWAKKERRATATPGGKRADDRSDGDPGGDASGRDGEAARDGSPKAGDGSPKAGDGSPKAGDGSPKAGPAPSDGSTAAAGAD